TSTTDNAQQLTDNGQLRRLRDIFLMMRPLLLGEEATSYSYVLTSLSFQRLNEEDGIAVEVANSELPGSIESVVDVFREIDSGFFAGGAAESCPDLAGFEKPVQLVDAVDVKPQTRIMLPSFTVHVDQDLGLSEGEDSEVHESVVTVSSDFLKSNGRIPVE